MTHHLGDIRTGATAAIVTGDSSRVLMLAEVVGGAGETWRNRGFECAHVRGQRLLVCSTGIGGPATAMVVEELVQPGIEQIVRVGTCGSMSRRSARDTW
jgi:uridine phosphorylase